MNDLSWLLYWADVAPQVSTAVCIASFLMFVFFGVFWLAAMFEANWSRYEKKDAVINKRLLRLGWFVWILPILWLASFFVPNDRETYYAIAASEVGEEVLKSPEVGKAREALNNWLDKQLKASKKEPEKADE